MDQTTPDPEKALLSRKESNTLPTFVALESPPAPRATSSRKVRIAILCCFSYWFFGAGKAVHQSFFKEGGSHASKDIEFRAAGYLDGLTGKGWRFNDHVFGTTPDESIQLLQLKSGHANHSAPDDKPHHGKHFPKWIGPKEAEKIFLTVPNNDSVAAASKRYTSTHHMAGSGNDYLSALALKAEYETLLHLPISAPFDNVYDAGSVESQEATRGLSERSVMAGPRVWVDTYYPVMNKPVTRTVDILLPGSNTIEWSASLREDIVEGDPTSNQRDEVPTFHGLATAGNVTAQIVYVGYGTKRDFEDLAAANVSVEGKIVLVKYGKVFRGLKIKAAQEAGAVACLIFTDPGDDGEKTVKNGYEQYPNGPARQESSVQRGSVQFISAYPGDPATPGYPAYPNATRLPGGNKPSIPSLPLSYIDALPLFKTLVGHGLKAEDVGSDWVGGLEGEPHGLEGYWTGPGDREVRFVNEVDEKVTPIWNTMAVIPGHIKDEIVVVGNHRDAWVLGGADPSSGTATTYEIVRGFSKLLESGWKPLRTILITSWDAEEYGLIGSTEWCEDFGDWIQDNVVAYLNLDVSVAGSNFHGSASPSLAQLIKKTAMEIEHPTDASRSLWSMSQDGGNWNEFNALTKGLVAEEDVEELFVSGTGIKALGSGSDYTAFLQRFGVASTDMGYGGGPTDPPYHYHSIYDSFTWQEKYADPGFHKHTAAAYILGLMTLRVADSLVLPLNVSQYALDLSGYLAKVSHIADAMGVTAELNLTSLADSIKTIQSATASLDNEAAAALKKLSTLIPHHHCGKGKSGIKAFFRRMAWRVKKFFRRSCHGPSSGEGAAGVVERISNGDLVGYEAHLEHHKHKALKDHKSHHHKRPHHDHPRRRMPVPKKIKEIKKVLMEIRSINQKLAKFESGFLSKEGIRDREWYKHKGTAPGKWLGYGATTFPALTEALTIEKSTTLAQEEADELADMINAMAKRLKA